MRKIFASDPCGARWSAYKPHPLRLEVRDVVVKTSVVHPINARIETIDKGRF